MTTTLELTQEVQVTEAANTAAPFTITVNKKELISAIKLLGKVIPAKPTHEILRCVLIQLDTVSRLVKLTTFDLCTQVCVYVSIQPDLLAEDVSLCAEFKLLSELVNSLNIADIPISVHPNKLTIAKGKSKYELPIIGSSEFPTIPAVDGVVIPLDKESIDKLSLASTFASKDYTKHILMGVNIATTNQGLTVQSSDGNRVCCADKQLERLEDSHITIPTNAVDMLKGLSGTVQVKVKDTDCTFSTDTISITTRLLEGNYPKIGVAIAMQCKPTRFISFDKAELLSALNVAKLFAATSTGNLIVMGFELDGVGGCQIKPNKPTGDGRNCSEDIAVVDDGSDGMIISFDHTLLSSILTAIPQKRVRFDITNRTAIVRFVGLDEELKPVPDCQLYLMPVNAR